MHTLDNAICNTMLMLPLRAKSSTNVAARSQHHALFYPKIRMTKILTRRVVALKSRTPFITDSGGSIKFCHRANIPNVARNPVYSCCYSRDYGTLLNPIPSKPSRDCPSKLLHPLLKRRDRRCGRLRGREQPLGFAICALSALPHLVPPKARELVKIQHCIDLGDVYIAVSSVQVRCRRQRARPKSPAAR